MKLPPKIRPFLWLVCHNALATKANLFQRCITIDSYCPICSTFIPETTEHLFLLCPWAQHLWSHPQINIPITQQSITLIDVWLVAQLEERRTCPDLQMIAALLWQIWKARNRFVFQQQHPDHLQVIHMAYAQVHAYNLSDPLPQQSTRSSLQRTSRFSLHPHSLWRPPDPVIFQRNQLCRPRSKLSSLPLIICHEKGSMRIIFSLNRTVWCW